MSALIDDISRAIASPVSRRQAFKMVSGAVAGAVLASLGLGRAARALGAPATTNPPCPDHEVRCGGRCYPPGYTCCGKAVCDGFHKCCTDHCCARNQTCCGAGCCSPGSTCCGNKTCCPVGSACCNGRCCAPRAICCGGACCPKGYLCCGGKCVKTRPSSNTPCIPV